jgi:hypothetical protein
MLLGNNPFANSRTLPSVIGFWAVGEDFFPDNGIFLLGKSFFANSSGLGCWEIFGLLAKPQFRVVKFREKKKRSVCVPDHRQTTTTPLNSVSAHDTESI